MARESKRNRDAKKYGTAERITDHVGGEPFVRIGEWSEPVARANCDLVTRSIAEKVIDATNVAEYAKSLDGRRYEQVIVNAVPPFKRCFVEMAEARDSDGVKSVGWGIEAYERGHEEDRIKRILTRLSPDEYRRATWVVLGSMAILVGNRPNGSSFVNCPAGQTITLLDDAGSALGDPIIFYSPPSGYERTDEATGWIFTKFAYAMLAFCFMNCKNVTLSPVEPNPIVNRERRKAGLKPFLRYHTININPMKEILRNEGGVEANGLKKALHICRGHFATYTDSMLGRKLDKPVTVWKPAHVRGSAKEGVVFSDYKVNAPAKAESATKNYDEVQALLKTKPVEAE